MDFDAYYREHDPQKAEQERRLAEFLPAFDLKKRIVKQSVGVILGEFAKNPPQLQSWSYVIDGGVRHVAWTFVASGEYDQGSAVMLYPRLGYVETRIDGEISEVLDIDATTTLPNDVARLSALYDSVVGCLSALNYDTTYHHLYTNNQNSRTYQEEHTALHPAATLGFPAKRQ